MDKPCSLSYKIWVIRFLLLVNLRILSQFGISKYHLYFICFPLKVLLFSIFYIFKLNYSLLKIDAINI